VGAPKKLTDEQVEQLRELAEVDGWSHEDLAQRFGISRQHVGRLVREDARPKIAGLDPDVATSAGVLAAVNAFLDDLVLKSDALVLAATAKAVASKLDACGASDSASAAQAVPRLASQLVEVLREIDAVTPGPPDRLDEIRDARAARLLAVAATGGTPRPAQAWGCNGNGNGAHA